MGDNAGPPFEERLMQLHASSLEIAQLRDVNDVLSRALDLCLELTGAGAGFVELLDEGRAGRETIVARGLEISEVGRPAAATAFLRTPLRVGGVVTGSVAVADLRGGHREVDGRLLGAFADQVAVALENARLYERQRRTISDLEQLRVELGEMRARDAEDARRRMLDQLVAAHEEERRRIAEDIHADSLQVLDAAILRLEMLSRRIGDPVQAGQLAEAKTAVSEAETRLRHLLFNLHPPAIGSQEGLRLAFHDHLEQIGRDSGIDWSLDVRVPDDVTVETRLTVFRIAQEAIANVVKHARATVVRVRAEETDGGVSARVEDDGRGGIAPDALSPPGHFGLTEMRARAELAGGWLRLRERPRGGTLVDYWIPRWAER